MHPVVEAAKQLADLNATLAVLTERLTTALAAQRSKPQHPLPSFDMVSTRGAAPPARAKTVPAWRDGGRVDAAPAIYQRPAAPVADANVAARSIATTFDSRWPTSRISPASIRSR